ncbi:MAG: hypothetical protein DMG01_16760 [Acidobacteria bacterium]|nr:MAG: hypothetical protein DMG01_16760 [Acidobacteriota bacterium]
MPHLRECLAELRLIGRGQKGHFLIMTGVGGWGLGAGGGSWGLGAGGWGRGYLNKSSNALRALVVSPLGAAGVLVWRSTVVRGVKNTQSLRSSFGATRAGSFALCVHSQRALVSNETH